MSIRPHFPATLPQQHTKYCFGCVATTVEKIISETNNGPQTKFLCTTCQQVSDRVRIWDPEMIQYFDENNNLVHDGAGMIVQNSAGQILFFLRTKYPFLWTIPGGHMTPGENSKDAAIRETKEEVGLEITKAELIFEGLIDKDECMGGADIHKWYLYLAKVDTAKVKLDDEGSQFGWFALDNLPDNITFPVRYLLGQNVVRKYL